MINFLSKITNKAQNRISDILKPVEEDLNRLEMKLSESLTSGNSSLDEIIGYVTKTGGKRLRPALVFLFAKALNNGFLSSNHFYLGEAVEMVHTASLIHDDVIDEAETRRGFLTVGKKWNYRTAVIVGDFILARSLTKLVSVGGIATEIFANTLNELCIGEIQQGDQKFKIISFEDYIKKSERKTAKLFVAGAECAATITPDANNLIIKAVRDYSLNFGIAFQIMDDILNLNLNTLMKSRSQIISSLPYRHYRDKLHLYDSERILKKIRVHPTFRIFPTPTNALKDENNYLPQAPFQTIFSHDYNPQR